MNRSGSSPLQDESTHEPPVPPLVHSFILGSGKRFDLKLHFDRTQWILEELGATRNLDELALNFSRITSTYEENRITFTVTINDNDCPIEIPYNILTYHDCARFRLGCLLSTLLSESEILYQNVPGMMPIECREFHTFLTVSITMKEEEDLIDRGSFSFVNDVDRRDHFGTKYLKVEDGTIAILPEVYALHSPFFLALFYNSDFKEAQHEIVTVKEVKVEQIRFLSEMFRAMRDYEMVDMGLDDLACCYRLFDRFLVPIPAEIDENLMFIARDCTINQDDFPRIIELSEIQKRMGSETNAMAAYLDRFVFAECLPDFIEQLISSQLLTPETLDLISKKMTDLLALTSRRPKLHFLFDNGVVIVEVPTDAADHLHEVMHEVAKMSAVRPIRFLRSPYLSFRSHTWFSCMDTKFLVNSAPVFTVHCMARGDQVTGQFEYQHHRLGSSTVIGLVVSGAHRLDTYTELISIKVIP